MTRSIFVLAMICFCAVIASAQKVYADRDTGRVLTITKTTRALPTQIETDGAGKSTLTPSADKAYTAFVLCVPAESPETRNCVSRVFVRDEKTKTVYEIKGEELFIEVARPIDEIKWKGHVLTYERWASPHIGRRYVLNMKTLKQTGGDILAG